MKALKRKFEFNRGQSIVIFTVSLAVLLMLMSVVLDGGLLLLRRREAQASADAGSLAGASYICASEPTAEEYTDATNAANNYANNLNQATSSVVTFPGVNRIQVVSTITQTPALAGLMGFGDIDVQALAIADCQNAGSVTNLMPFVFICIPPGEEDESDSEDCLQQVYDEDTAGGPPEYDYYILVHDSDPSDGDLICIFPPNTTPEDESTGWESGYFDCDFDDDNVDDIIDSANRGWVSLDGSVGANPLTTWIEEGFGGEIPIHVWLSDQPGTSNAVFGAIEDYQVGNVVLIPVYDDICNFPDPEVDCSARWHDDSTPPDSVIPAAPNLKYYHIIGFTGFKIMCVFNSGDDDCGYRDYLVDTFDEYDDLLKTPSVKSVEGYFVSVVSSDFGAGGGVDAGGYIVRLTQ